MSKSLNRVIVEEYLKDLRGGNFLQCRGKLHEGEAHCAIGVFSLTYERITGKKLKEDPNYLGFEGIIQISPELVWGRNDNGMTFSEIADYIECNSPVMNEMKEKVNV